jgi:hypothetical protein
MQIKLARRSFPIVALVAVLVLVLFCAPGLFAQTKASGYALIYNGKVAAEGGPEAVATVARGLGLEVKFIADIGKLPDMLKGAAVFVIGGTEDDLTPLQKAFNPTILAALKDWLNAGGRYWGICGGGYMASKGWEDTNGFEKALELIPAESIAYVEEADPMIINVKWLGKERTMYYQYGPAFIPDKGAKISILSTYDDGTIAALIVPYGKGKVAVVGPHPEADETWLDDDPPPADAEAWESTADIASAMLKELLAP